MGHVFAEIELSNPRQPDFAPIKANALADTGALMLCIPQHIANQLNLETESLREVSVADGRSSKVPYVGALSKRDLCGRCRGWETAPTGCRHPFPNTSVWSAASTFTTSPGS